MATVSAAVRAALGAPLWLNMGVTSFCFMCCGLYFLLIFTFPKPIPELGIYNLTCSRQSHFEC